MGRSAHSSLFECHLQTVRFESALVITLYSRRRRGDVLVGSHWTTPESFAGHITDVRAWDLWHTYISSNRIQASYKSGRVTETVKKSRFLGESGLKSPKNLNQSFWCLLINISSIFLRLLCVFECIFYTSSGSHLWFSTLQLHQYL